MSNKRRPLLLLARLCVVFGCATALVASDTPPRATQPSAATGASAQPAGTEAPPTLRSAGLVKSSPALSWPVLMRLRWSVLLEELLRTASPPEPVNSTQGLSDDPDPVGSTQDGDDPDEDERDGSKKGWKSQNSNQPPDPFDGKSGNTQIHFPIP